MVPERVLATATINALPGGVKARVVDVGPHKPIRAAEAGLQKSDRAVLGEF